MNAKECDRESRRDTWFENRLVLYCFGTLFVNSKANSTNIVSCVCFCVSADSMLATWDSVNGSTASSPRNSCASLSSEGSFLTNADFANAVAAAAEHVGMQVAAGSQNGDQRLGW